MRPFQSLAERDFFIAGNSYRIPDWDSFDASVQNLLVLKEHTILFVEELDVWQFNEKAIFFYQSLGLLPKRKFLKMNLKGERI